MANITSKDPRKKTIVVALKRKSGGSKITMVKELKDGTFQGNSMKHNGKGQPCTMLGFFTVTKEEAGL